MPPPPAPQRPNPPIIISHNTAPPKIPFPINGKATYTTPRTFGVKPAWADVRPYAGLDPSRSLITGAAPRRTQRTRSASGDSTASSLTLTSTPSLFVIPHGQENDAYVAEALVEGDMESGIVIAHAPSEVVYEGGGLDTVEKEIIRTLQAKVTDAVGGCAIEDVGKDDVEALDKPMMRENLAEMYEFYRDEEIMETIMDEEHVSPRLKELLASTLNSVEYTSPIQAVFDKYKCMPYAPGGPLAIKNLASAYILDTSIDDSFYVFDLGAVQRLYDAWQTAMPRVRPFYALKCSPMPAMIDLMKENGCGFDCASAAEIKMVLDAGVTQDRIIFAHPAKRPSDVRFAQKNGVKKTTFDSLVELEKIKKWHPDADCVLRIRADDPDAGISFGIKYGASPDEYEPLVRKCTELGLNLVGVSFHVGSLARSGAAFYEAIKQARVAFDCAKDLGFTMTFLDIGGGFTGRVNSSGVVQSMVGDIPANINESLEEFFGEACGYGEVAVIAEPGRYFAEASMHLACHVHSVRNREGEDNSATCDYLISDGLYGSFNCVVYDGAKPRAWLLPSPSLPPLDNALIRSTVFGPTCDSMDCVFKDVMLPQLRVGDWLLFPCFGAYTLAGATNFNGIMAAAPDIIYINSGTSVDEEDSLVMWACEMSQPPSDIVAA